MMYFPNWDAAVEAFRLKLGLRVETLPSAWKAELERGAEQSPQMLIWHKLPVSLALAARFLRSSSSREGPC